MERSQRWTVEYKTDHRGVKVSQRWSAEDSKYSVIRKPMNNFHVISPDGRNLGMHGMLSDAIDQIERLEATDLATGDREMKTWSVLLAKTDGSLLGIYVTAYTRDDAIFASAFESGAHHPLTVIDVHEEI